MVDISVIICTHNPRQEYLCRVLKALRNQILPLDKWELLLIDNASEMPLAFAWDISWHPNGRHVSEKELGLAPARRRGMQEASADLLVFVDDDNMLNESYLSEALKIEHAWPVLGAWGAGSIAPEYELEPPEYLKKFVPYLALRETMVPKWSNVPSCLDAIPWGAGLCVRASVATAYLDCSARSTIQITGRQGKTLSAGEDNEISIVACMQGFGVGIFPELKLTHLISRDRVSEQHFVKLAEGAAIAGHLLNYKWNSIVPDSPISVRGFLSALRSIVADQRIDRRIHFAWMRARLKARRIIG
jgi:GT2 family glycosyltransferase